MCAIVDANVASQLVGTNRPEAGIRFLDYVQDGRLMLVVGGKLRQELDQTPMGKFIQEAILAEKARSVEDKIVDQRTGEIERSKKCASDDPHIIALAQISGARLLFTNDKDLQQDFKDQIKQGRIYTTLKYDRFHSSHRGLLNRSDLCRSGDTG